MSIITKDELEKLKELAGKATPGDRTWVDFDGINLVSSKGKIILNTVHNVHVNNMAFIASTNPDTILRLIEALEVCTSALESCRNTLEEDRNSTAFYYDNILNMIYGE